jgi:hypothetical protein
MASSYSTDLKLELMVTGENAGTWGDNTNNNLNLIQQAIAGYEAIALSDGGTVTLAMTDKTISNARNMVIKFTGTLTTASTVTIPDSIEKFYIFDLSAVTGVTNLTVKTVSGTGFTAGEAKIVAAYSDGTNLNEIALDTLGGTIGTAQIADNAITSAKISANQITTAKISDNQITTAKISDNQITTAKISDNQITTAKIADDAVTADKLADTAVTAGAYTSASITVDAQGRLTAASSGSAGAGAFLLKSIGRGPGSGTYTANPGANGAGAYLCSGGGGGGGGGGNGSASGAPGGSGGYGFYYGPVSGGTGYPYSIGGGGSPGPGGDQGNAGGGGGATNLSIFGTINGGNGGGGGRRSPPFPGASPGNTGTLAPGYVTAIPTPFSFQMPGGIGGGGGGGASDNDQGSPGQSGGVGFVVVYDNAGT